MDIFFVNDKKTAARNSSVYNMIQAINYMILLYAIPRIDANIFVLKDIHM